MNKLKIHLEYCYGICNLEEEIDFSSKRTCAIYSPNGVMKTSFARTFQDLSLEQASSDLAYPERDTIRSILIDDDNELEYNEVFVIEPYNDQFKSDKLSTLLVSKDLKNEYEGVYRELEFEKNELIKKLKTISQSTDCESELISTFQINDTDTIFDILEKSVSSLTGKLPRYSFRYNDVFDKQGKVQNFLKKHKDNIESYSQNYEDIISKSSVFKKSDNSFGTYQASEILKSVSDNSFFDAGHILELTGNTKIKSAEEFQNVLESEVKKVVSDKSLKEIFDKIEKDLGSNIPLRAFKEVIEKNNLLIVELRNYEEFRKKVWLGYLDEIKDDVINLVNLYKSKKTELEEIIKKAKDEETDWERAVGVFNNRFKGLPFKLKMVNKEDVLLKTNRPSVEFLFFDDNDEKPVGEEELLSLLSQGERRALYILNIVFEIEARKKSRQKTLFIIDDIADSFDYKNKYAIIEYLNDIQKEDFFYQIILTHNFDFYRSISGRLHLPEGNKLRAVKKPNEIIFCNEQYIFDPFNTWKNNLDNASMLIASIPFVRNLAGYSGYNGEKAQLTCLLHIKPETGTIYLEDLENIYMSVINNMEIDLPYKRTRVIDVIYETADEILAIDEETLNLENKIVISIAIRLKAEEFMINEISDPSFVAQIRRNQTITLIEKYKEISEHNHDLLDQVNLMTPENIHLNSFMYEPILDLGDDHLKDLYRNVLSLA